MTRQREAQLAYSEIQSKMSDQDSRQRKTAKIMAVLDHFLGDDWPEGRVLVDIGASLGWTVEAAAARGATSIGVDIDVPGLSRASTERDPRCHFACADGGALPFPDGSVDVVVYNHIYEHLVDPDAVMSEIKRVLAPQGAVYMGLGNKLGIMEPHQRLPFLSWLPEGLADRYVKAFGTGDHYYERYRTIPGLKHMVDGLTIYDYSFSIMAHPAEFLAEDMVGGKVASLVRGAPSVARSAVRQVMPTVIWIGSRHPRTPAGPPLAVAPERIVG